MKVKRPKNICWCHPRKGYASAHRVQTGDSFVSLASKYGFSDPWDIIQYNYGTKDPEEVNWYLQELVGCTQSRDGINYSFDTSDKFGTVYIPPKGWKPGHEESSAYGFFQIKDSKLSSSQFRTCPYVDAGTICRIFNEKIFIVGDKNLRTPAEYNYGNIIFMSIPDSAGTPGRSGGWDPHWLYKEVIHLAYGAHGMKMSYSLRTEAVALIGAMMAGGRNNGQLKVAVHSFSIPWHFAKGLLWPDRWFHG